MQKAKTRDRAFFPITRCPHTTDEEQLKKEKIILKIRELKIKCFKKYLKNLKM
jgi:hypothetical protein